MHNDELGKLISKNTARERDAIHIAIAPLVAGQILKPGQHITLKSTGSNIAVAATARKASIAIVDPWLKNNVEEGQEFWACLHPNTIKSLRHSWTHDDFILPTNEQQKNASREWLEEYANEIDLSYEELIEAADRHIRYGEYYIYRGMSPPNAVYSKNDEFWKHYENVTRIVVSDGDKEVFFSCSC